MQNLENLDVFEILITQKLLKCPKDPFVRSALSEDVLLLIINNIHNLSFLFSGKIMSLQDKCGHFDTQSGVINFVLSYFPQKKGLSRVQLILVYFDK